MSLIHKRVDLVLHNDSSASATSVYLTVSVYTPRARLKQPVRIDPCMHAAVVGAKLQLMIKHASATKSDGIKQFSSLYGGTVYVIIPTYTLFHSAIT